MKKIISILLLCATFLFTSCKDPIPVVVTDVKINKDILSLVVGTKEVLVATVNPKDADDKSVTWSSSDVAVATVSTNGEVSALKVGVATITVTSNSDKTKKATCTLTVTAASVPVASVALKAAASIVEGATETLVPVILPENATNKDLTWASSNITIATVSASGVVTALAAGETVITAASNADAAKVATCTVTVTPAAVPVASVSLDKTTANMFTGATETLVPVILPEKATNKKIVWSSDNNAVATVSDAGVVNALTAGTATITATTKDGAKTATCLVTVTVEVVAVVSLGLDKADLNVEMGKTATLIATVNPSNATTKAITWKSSDIAIATVLGGVITPVKEGNVVITITSDADNTIKAACAVSVIAAAVPSI